jgi:hypothetical protein
MSNDEHRLVRVGRPLGSGSKAEQVLTPETLGAVAELLLEGNYKETVADFLGIHRATWWRWEQLGERDPQSIYGDFCNVVKKASAGAEISLLRSIRHGWEGWQSKAWIAERRFPQRWGRRVEVTLRQEAEKIAERYGKTVDQVLKDAEEIASGAGGG